jgi:3-oxoacyl-[acyl-carrier-protein] synthase-3
MGQIRSKITGVGSYVPPKVFTNFDLEEMLDTSDEWIRQRSGIIKRHWVEPGVANSDLAVEAATKAISDAGLEKSDIDMIVYATLSPDHDFPGSACFFQDKMDMPGIAAIDIRQQCTGYLYGLSIADKFIRANEANHVLVIGSEVHSAAMDLTPAGRAVSVLFGDAAAVTVVSKTEVHDPSKDSHIIHSKLHADGSFAKELWIPAPGNGCGGDKGRISHEMLEEGLHYPKMNGKTVFTHAIKRMAETLTQCLDEAGYKIEDVDLFLFHQANLRINTKVAEVLGINDERVFNTIQDYGNTTAATIPLGMDVAVKQGVLKPGMLVASAAFGSGFTWASGLWRQ